MTSKPTITETLARHTDQDSLLRDKGHSRSLLLHPGHIWATLSESHTATMLLSARRCQAWGVTNSLGELGPLKWWQADLLPLEAEIILLDPGVETLSSNTDHFFFVVLVCLFGVLKCSVEERDRDFPDRPMENYFPAETFGILSSPWVVGLHFSVESGRVFLTHSGIS